MEDHTLRQSSRFDYWYQATLFIHHSLKGNDVGCATVIENYNLTLIEVFETARSKFHDREIRVIVGMFFKHCFNPMHEIRQLVIRRSDVIINMFTSERYSMVTRLIDVVDDEIGNIIRAVWYDESLKTKNPEFFPITTLEMSVNGEFIFHTSVRLFYSHCKAFTTAKRMGQKNMVVVNYELVKIGEIIHGETFNTNGISGSFHLSGWSDLAERLIVRLGALESDFEGIFGRSMIEKEVEAMGTIGDVFNCDEVDRRDGGRLVELGDGGMCKPTKLLIGTRCGLPTLEWKGQSPPLRCACQSTSCGDYTIVNITDKISYADLSRTIEYLRKVAVTRYKMSDDPDLSDSLSRIKREYLEDMTHLATRRMEKITQGHVS